MSQSAPSSISIPTSPSSATPSTIIRCSECNQEFIFERGEQDFYKGHGYPPPKRCPLCRRWKKFRRESRAVLASDLNAVAQ